MARPSRETTYATSCWRDAVVRRIAAACRTDACDSIAALDLAELDAEAAQLHLPVRPPEILELARGPAPHAIAGAVERRARRRRKWIGQEALGGQIRTAEISPADAGAAEIELADHAVGHGFEAGIEDVRRHVVHRQADRHALEGLAAPAVPDDRINRHFGRAVEVHEPGARGSEAPLLQIPGQRLAADEDAAKRRQAVEAVRVEEQAEQRRHDLENRDLPLGDRADEILRILVSVGPRENEGRAGHERRVEFPHGRVEARRRLLQHAVAGGERVDALHPAHVVRQRAVRDHHALGASGRSRREDHVGDRIGGRPRRQVRVVVWQRPGEALVRDDERMPGVLDHQSDPIGRVRRIDRRVRAARLQHRQHRDHEVDRALESERDDRVGADAEVDEAPGEPVRAPVERVEGQRLVARHQGDRARRRRGARLECRVRQRRLAVHRRAAGHGQRSRPLAGVEHRDCVERLFRAARGRRHESREVARHPLQRGRLEEIGPVLERRQPSAVRLGNRQADVELRGRRLEREGREAQAGQRERRRRVLQREHGLHDRVVPEITRRLHQIHEALERQVLVRVRLDGRLPDAAKEIDERHGARHVGSKRQRVHEEADEVLGLGARSPGDGRADGEVVLPGVAREQDLERREKRHERRRVLGAGQADERVGRGAVDGERHAGAVEPERGGARAIGRQLERRHAVEARLPVVDERRRAGAGEARALPARHVGVLHAQHGKRERS